MPEMFSHCDKCVWWEKCGQGMSDCLTYQVLYQDIKDNLPIATLMLKEIKDEGNKRDTNG